MESSDSFSPQSLFDQKLDRAVSVAYFLGAIVPLVALAVVAVRYALPTLEHSLHERVMLLSVVLAVAVLTLASFFALRRLSLRALARMDGDNARLNALVAASRALGGAPHPQAVAEATIPCARLLTNASAAFLVRRGGAGKDMAVYESSGEEAEVIYSTHEDHFVELIDAAMSDSQPITSERSDAASSNTEMAGASTESTIVCSRLASRSTSLPRSRSRSARAS